MRNWYDDSPVIAPKPWMKTKHMELVTAQTIHEIVDLCIESGKYAHDIETTGLDNRVFNGRTRDHIVGHCLSPDGKRGFYIPVRHKKGEHLNLPITLVEEEMRRLGDSPAVAVFFNAAFDQEFLEFPGGKPLGSRWDDRLKWEDAALDAYIYNPRNKNRNLKDLSKLHLNMEMIKLEELFPPGYTGKLSFAELDPSEDAVLWYGCSDAICTWLLHEFLSNLIKDQPGPLIIEKLCLPSVRWMERNRVKIDAAKVNELIQLGQEEYYDALISVYDACKQKLGRSIEPVWMTMLRKGFDRTDPKFDILEQIKDLKKRAELRRGLEEVVFTDLCEDIPEPQGYGEAQDSIDTEKVLNFDLDPFVLREGFHSITHHGGRCGDGFSIQEEGPIRKAIKGEIQTFPRTYDLLSASQFGRLLEELEVPDLRTTEVSGQVDTSAEEIERLSKEYGHAYPFLPLFSRMGELRKAISTYLTSLRDDVAPDGTVRIRFRQTGTDTGRFTTPASKDPSQDGGTKFPMHGTPATYDKTRPKCLLKIREAIVPRNENSVILAADFSGVELRIATNISGEPKWYREFFRCSTCTMEFDRGNGTDTPEAPPPYCPRCGSDRIGDLHTLTGLVFYGEERMTSKEGKELRQKSKTGNFALVYGGGPRALQAATGCDDNEAHRQFDQFSVTYNVLGQWWSLTRSLGAKFGYVQTCFGRRYPTPDLQLPTDRKGCPNPEQREINKSLKSKAERNASNSPIQGSSADITKIAMGKVYLECKKRGWLDKVRMIATMHDELVFDIELDVLVEASQVLPEIMTRNKAILGLKWKVPLTSDTELGFDYTVPWNLKNFISRRVRRDGVEVEADGKPTKTKWPQKFLEVFGPVYGFADDADAPKLTKEPPKPATQVHLIEVPSLSVGLVESLAHMLLRVNGTGTHRLDVRLKGGTSLLWPGANFLVDPALCTLDDGTMRP